MRLGAALPVTGWDGGAVDAGHFARSAERLEALGFASIWVFDAVVLDLAPSEDRFASILNGC